MIPKVHRHGSGFRGALEYVLRKDHRPEIIGRNETEGSTPQQLAYEFGFSRAVRPEVEKPVLHLTVSYHEVDAAKLSVEIRQQAAAQLVEHLVTQEGQRRGEALDPAEFQWVLVSHHDKAHPHDHLVMSRIALDGSLFYGENEGRAARVWADRFEAAHPDLVPARGEDRIAGRHPAPGASIIDRTGKEAAERGVPLVRDQVAQVVRSTLAEFEREEKPSTEGAVQGRLAKQGYLLEVSRLPSGDRRGVTVAVADPHRPGQAVELPDGTQLRWSGAQLGFRGGQALHRIMDAAERPAAAVVAPVTPAETPPAVVPTVPIPPAPAAPAVTAANRRAARPSLSEAERAEFRTLLLATAAADPDSLAATYVARATSGMSSEYLGTVLTVPSTVGETTVAEAGRQWAQAAATGEFTPKQAQLITALRGSDAFFNQCPSQRLAGIIADDWSQIGSAISAGREGGYRVFTHRDGRQEHGVMQRTKDRLPVRQGLWVFSDHRLRRQRWGCYRSGKRICGASWIGGTPTFERGGLLDAGLGGWLKLLEDYDLERKRRQEQDAERARQAMRRRGPSR